MNQKITFLFLCCVLFANQIFPMQRTSTKLSKTSWFQKLKNYWHKPTPLNFTPKSDFKTLILAINNNHEKFMNWYHKLSWYQQKQLAKAMDSYLRTINLLNNIENTLENTNDIDFLPNDLFLTLKKTYNDILENQAQIQKAIPEGIESWNATSVENLALQHFQDTQAPSNLYVPIHSVNKDLSVINDFVNNDLIITEARYQLGHITTGKEFQNLSPAVQYKTILHEYRHHLQMINDVFGANLNQQQQQKFYPANIVQEMQNQTNNPKWLIYERDADNFATERIKCPTCLKIIQINHYRNKSAEGYFNHEDLEPFVQAAAKNAFCPAHTKTPGDEQHNFIVQQLEEKLTMLHQYPLYRFDRLFVSSEFKKFELHYFEFKDLKKQIQDLDKQSGSLLAHIPNYNRDFIRRIAEQKEFQELLGAKLLKELDVRNTMAKTEKLSEQGEFPLLEASKLSSFYPLSENSASTITKSD